MTRKVRRLLCFTLAKREGEKLVTRARGVGGASAGSVNIGVQTSEQIADFLLGGSATVKCRANNFGETVMHTATEKKKRIIIINK